MLHDSLKKEELNHCFVCGFKLSHVSLSLISNIIKIRIFQILLLRPTSPQLEKLIQLTVSSFVFFSNFRTRCNIFLIRDSYIFNFISTWNFINCFCELSKKLHKRICLPESNMFLVVIETFVFSLLIAITSKNVEQ